jgi:hypothetical protein
MASEIAADKLMKEAEKALKPSVMSMRLKPKWDEAYPLFEKAAMQYKVRAPSKREFTPAVAALEMLLLRLLPSPQTPAIVRLLAAAGKVRAVVRALYQLTHGPGHSIAG